MKLIVSRGKPVRHPVIKHFQIHRYAFTPLSLNLSIPNQIRESTIQEKDWNDKVKALADISSAAQQLVAVHSRAIYNNCHCKCMFFGIGWIRYDSKDFCWPSRAVAIS